MKKSLALLAVSCAAALFTPLSHAQDLYVGSNSSGVTTNFTSGTNSYDNTYVGYDPGANSNTLNVLNTNTLLTNSGDLYVGYDGSGNSLVISNGGRVANGTDANAIAYIGYTNTASNNSVLVTGANSLWTNSGELRVGNDGSGNSLVISNGGTVANYYAYIGHNTNSSNNSVLVAGTNSLWTNSGDLVVGFEGSSNNLTIADGATVASQTSYLGDNLASSNNSVLVTGSNSLWSTKFDLYVGEEGHGNSLVISNGGRVESANSYIGYYGSSNNLLVTGAGSSLVVEGELRVSYDANTGNSMTIADGGSVSNVNGYVGSYSPDSSNNSVLVTGTNSLWTNSGDLYVGEDGHDNSLVISNGGTVAVVSNSYIGYTNTSSNNSVLVTGTNSLWTNSGDLVVGFQGGSNNLTIADGATVASQTSYLGDNSASSNNSVLVTGSNSLWTNSGGMNVGYGGSSNSLTIADGGTVANATGFIGFFSSNNSVLVTGTNSLWTNSSGIFVGYEGSGNSIVITNGGRVSAIESGLGQESSSSNNSALVTGAGSLWTNSLGMSVGFSGSSNILVISNGGTVANYDGYIAYSATSSNNSVLVTGAGSQWTNSGDLYVGNAGSSNTMQVADGGTVAVATNSYIGFSATASNNSVLVTGTNSLWTNSRDLYFGYEGSGNSLVISNGGTVASQVLVLGGSPESVLPSTTSSNNSMLVTGEGSVWNGQAIFVGFSGSSNSLVISNGGTVAANNYSIIGVTATSSNNSVLVTGTNSLWTNSSDLYFGYEGSGNSVVISNGGTVAVASNSYIGYTNTSSNNSVLVTGTNSLWSNSEAIVVGTEGAGNSLVISNGGTVQSQVLVLGGSFFSAAPSTASSNNIMLVTGEGSAWLGQAIAVGFFGSGNSLVISNGGTVVDAYGSIGEDSTSSNNSVLVTGAGSLWTSGIDLTVGGSGSGNSLVISDGGKVANANAYIGFATSSSNNSVLVTGTSSLWTNSGELRVGQNGSGENLTVANGGTVASGAGCYIGLFSSNNSVLVTGTNSLLTNSGELNVGYVSGSGNSLNISNGGKVVNTSGYIGYDAASSNNSVLVTGTGSLWTNGGGDLYVGVFGSGNSLTVANGGTVANTSGYIGSDAASSNNSVLVTGAASLWTNSGLLTVGNQDNGNSLTVANGGTVAASSIDIASQAGSSGTLNIGRLGTNDTAGTIIAPTIAFGSGAGTINFNQSDATTMSALISGAGALNQLGAGTTTLSASNSYTGATTVASGELKVNGSISGSAVTVQSGAALSGSGAVGALSGAGSINPGNSPGILTAVSLNPGGGLDFNFEFTSLNPTYASATASGNDVLRLTDATPFVASLAAGNAVNIYFNVGLLEAGQIYTGGFYTDTDADFLASIDSALFTYYVKDAAGSVTYGGETYAALGSGLDITLTTVSQSADFAGGTVNGRVAQFEVVPEPSTYALLALAAAGLGGYSLRRKLPGFLNRR